MSEPMSDDELEQALHAVGAERYHHLHPYQIRLQSGGCSRFEVAAWALNRYLYQACIPQKDAIILSRMDDPALRRAWRQRIVDHDGEREGDGGIARWLKLTDDLGLDREAVVSGRLALPATKFAVNAYLTFVRERPLLEAVASSLTELFSPQIIRTRVAGMLEHYDFVTQDTLAYFAARPLQAGRDSDFALAYVKRHARTRAGQKAAVAALRWKCDMLWAMLDALEHAYVLARPAPGALREQDADPVGKAA